MVETLKHSEAFEYYYLLGNNRTLIQVASRFKVSVQTTTKWNRSFGWQERVQLRDINNAKKLEAKTDVKVVDDKAKMLKVLRTTMNQYVTALNNGEVEVKTVADFERLVKTSLLLQGENNSEEQVKIIVERVTDDTKES